jgi:hypothetical protein
MGDDDAVAERLAPARAERRHLRRLRGAERCDGAREGVADENARKEAERSSEPNQLAVAQQEANDTRRLLLAEEAAVELDRASLVADREIADSFEPDF